MSSNNGHKTPLRSNASGAIFTIAMISVFIAVMVVFMKLDIIPSPIFFDKMLGNDDDRVVSRKIDQISADFGGGIPKTNTILLKKSDDHKAVLSDVEEYKTYVRKYRVINSYRGRTDIKKYVLTVKNGKFRLDTDGKTICGDGEKIVMKSKNGISVLSGSDFDIYSESGITSLAEVKREAENGSVTINNVNNKDIVVISHIADLDITNEYTVSEEYGVVLSERSYVGREMYRLVISDSIDVFEAESIGDENFIITE